MLRIDGVEIVTFATRDIFMSAPRNTAVVGQSGVKAVMFR